MHFAHQTLRCAEVSLPCHEDADAHRRAAAAPAQRSRGSARPCGRYQRCLRHRGPSGPPLLPRALSLRPPLLLPPPAHPLSTVRRRTADGRGGVAGVRDGKADGRGGAAGGRDGKADELGVDGRNGSGTGRPMGRAARPTHLMEGLGSGTGRPMGGVAQPTHEMEGPGSGTKPDN